MPTNSEVYNSFIRSVKKKYRGLTQPENLFSQPNNFTRGRFTGKGPDMTLRESEPAGTVHEGEFVVSAPDVRNAGGPGGVNKAVENAVNAGPPPAAQPTKPAQEPGEFRRGGFAGEKPRYQAGGIVGGFGDKVKNIISKSTEDIIGTATTAGETATGLPTSTPQETAKTAAAEAAETASGAAAAGAATSVAAGQAAGAGVGQAAANRFAAEQAAAAADETPFERIGAEEADITGAREEREPVVTERTDVTTRAVTPSQIQTPEERAATRRAGAFETLQDEQISELQNIAAGEGTASQVIGDIARQKLAGQLGAGNMAAEQAAAQMGLSGGSLAAARARRRRDNAIAQTGLEGQLAVDAVARAENAVLQLAGIAERGAQFEEMKRQFGTNFDLAKANFGLEKEKFEEFKQQFQDNLGLQIDQLNLNIDNANELRAQFKDNMDLAWTKLSENMRQFDAGVALNMFLNDTDVAKWQADSLMLAGDYDGAASVYKDKFGIDIDLTDLKTAQQEKNFGNAMANFITDLDNIPSDMAVFHDNGDISAEGMNTDAMRDLARAWNAQHPTNQVDINDPSSWNKNGNFKGWAKNTIDATTAHKSPYYSMIQAFGDEELGNLILGITQVNEETGEQESLYRYDETTGKYLSNVDDTEFTYAGENGIEAVEAAYSNMLHTRAMTTQPDGTFSVDPNNPLMQVFGGGEKPGSPEAATAERIANFYETADPDLLTETDIENLDPNKIIEMEKAGLVLKQDIIGKGDPQGLWRDLDNLDNDEARKKFRDRFPELTAEENEGKIINYNNKLYVITDTAHITHLKNNNKRLSVQLTPVGGGEPIDILKTKRFEPRIDIPLIPLI